MKFHEIQLISIRSAVLTLRQSSVSCLILNGWLHGGSLSLRLFINLLLRLCWLIHHGGRRLLLLLDLHCLFHCSGLLVLCRLFNDRLLNMSYILLLHHDWLSHHNRLSIVESLGVVSALNWLTHILVLSLLH